MATLKGSYDVHNGTNIMQDGWLAKGEAKLAEIQKAIKARRPGDALAGELWQSQVADGFAVYVVESSKPLVLSHVNLCDGYHVLGAMIRGLRLQDIKAYVQAERALAELFARKS